MNIQDLISYYEFELLPVEECYFKNTYVSSFLDAQNRPCGTSMLGLYCNKPKSKSLFHVLDYDETWYFQGGDPIRLMLIHPDGQMEEVILGSDISKNQVLQHTIPAHTYQAGCLLDQGEYALFGCAVTPGFDSSCFHAGYQKELLQKFPQAKSWIDEFGVR